MKRLWLVFIVCLFSISCTVGSASNPLSDDGQKITIDQTTTTINTPETPPVIEAIIPADSTSTTTAAQTAKRTTTKKTVEKEYVVVAGDSLWNIAEEYLGDGRKFWEIVKANKDKYPSLLNNPDLILEGWELVIPTEEVQVAKSGDTSAKSGKSSKSTTSDTLKVETLTVEQKINKLQKAVTALNRILVKQGLTLSELNAQTVRLMIDKGIITDEEWMSLQPPEGYQWAINNNEVTLTSRKGNPITSDELSSIDTTIQTSDPTGEDATSTAVKTQSHAQANYAKDLAALGMKDITPYEREYLTAISKAKRILPDDLLDTSPLNAFAMEKSLHWLQYKLLSAEEQYEKNVKEKDTTNSWWNPLDDDIQSAAKNIEQCRAALKEAWAEFKPLYRELKSKVASCKVEISQTQAANKQIDVQLAKLDQYNPDNAAKLDRLLKAQKANNEIIKDRQEQVNSFEPLRKLFNM